MRQAVILAGGKGTRLRERLGGLPKPLIDIVGMPLLERQILLAKQHGIDDILILVNHAAEHIVDFCARRDNWGLNIACIDDGEPRGTAGATLAILDRLADEFLVIYGDTMLEVDLDRFVAFHRARPDAAATLFVHPNDHPHDSDLVEAEEDGRIAAFHPYPHDPDRHYPNLVNAALYCVRRAALEPWRGTPGMLDFGKDLFPAMLERGLTLQAYNSPEYIKDCGTPARLDKVCGDLTSGRIARASLSVPQAAVFLDRDGTINLDGGHIASPDRFELLPGVGPAIRRLNRSDYRAIVVTNQPVLARGDCDAAGLTAIHNKMETLLGRDGAYLDRIYHCPHHPDRGFPGEVPELKIACDCRKPATGMIERAVAELNVDPARSWMVGDTTVDMMTARRAGLRAVLVETGEGGLDARHGAVPDYAFPDLPAAVDFILDGHPRLLAQCDALTADVAAGDIIVVGGLARGGKSTLAAGLAESLRARGLGAAVVATDRWLRPAAERQDGVLGRHDMAELTAVTAALAGRVATPGGTRLEVPVYDKKARGPARHREVLEIPAGAVLVVEGVAALSLTDALTEALSGTGRRVHALAVEADEEVRHRRILREYARRGMAPDEAEALYRSRMEDEAPVIRAAVPAAARRVRLDPSDE
ncbi:D,D-heptose 1,7-bisphosphate phosphatase [Azospirillum brasilense]|uniref:D,D-heptose 1,7-bisphosphate phosphatase n=1 Tax=Azospirillum brasilense TaxID=192 RepID=A0A560BWW9_AZOBR|nr:HAD-IIIA family hydrolase [Azospirillum brasilense]MBK3732873.1 HAD-IIIA family hydrolase [Azospirillum brasilense]TWA77104.1 D,D-heptose 1,7-bisphosphate phosphatase [Azospirillum brasilense]